MAPVLGVIIGSVRTGRVGPTVAQWFVRRASADGRFEVRVLDLADVVLPMDLSGGPGVDELTRWVDVCDAFVLVTPEYNHGYPASLKLALDSVKLEWRGKPVGFVSYGGTAGGVRAVEQLRQVVAELHMASVRDAVLFPRVKKAFDAHGETSDGAAIDGAQRMIDQLLWWSEGAGQPYPRG
ncbi:NAD(P)H-dependent oxidoreductase [Rhodococcus sp. BP-332]|uniref:NADPH-dependent FMN reductase n=1 Tax=Rhodococcus sp. BP-332 TaxID=2739447 RepID=UPI001C9AF688|nr:NAD(P)H-dependent oxidoreductase [Rhodococcus sp. BP-332]MBY6677912.1 NAD(P)H-dependent oxidoreductase [Rhodococcus sp. BP-332]